VLLQLLITFVEDSIAVLGDAQVAQELGTANMKMSLEDAIVLFYTGNYNELQWNQMAKSVNKLMDVRLRRKFGSVIPVVGTIKKQCAPKCSFGRCTFQVHSNFTMSLDQVADACTVPESLLRVFECCTVLRICELSAAPGCAAC
jgi:hypothetical protein